MIYAPVDINTQIIPGLESILVPSLLNCSNYIRSFANHAKIRLVL